MLLGLKGILMAFGIAILVFIPVGFLTRHVHVNNDTEQCLIKKSWSKGEWKTLYAISKLELRYRAKNYDCPVEAKLDPDKYELKGTQIQLRTIAD